MIFVCYTTLENSNDRFGINGGINMKTTGIVFVVLGVV